MSKLSRTKRLRIHSLTCSLTHLLRSSPIKKCVRKSARIVNITVAVYLFNLALIVALTVDNSRQDFVSVYLLKKKEISL